MKVVKQGFEVITPLNREVVLKRLERIGRTCYKSEDRITPGSASRFVKLIVQNGHEAILEHASITVKFITDRGISHQIVRHRIASYAQESTRYCNYIKDKFDGQITVIEPPGLKGDTKNLWFSSCAYAEVSYFGMINDGITPEIARAVLPTCLKTELVVTMNLREWRHFLRLRTDSHSHPQIVSLVTPLLELFKKELPEVFEDINPEIAPE